MANLTPVINRIGFLASGSTDVASLDFLQPMGSLFIRNAGPSSMLINFITVGATAAGASGLRALTSNIATITTTAAHGLIAGNLVTVSGMTNTTFNGTFIVTTAPTTKSITFVLVAADVVSASDTGFTLTPSAPIALVGARRERTTNVSIVTVPTAHGIVAGSRITVTGMTDTTFNGSFTVTSVTATTITYPNTGGNVADAADTGFTVTLANQLKIQGGEALNFGKLIYRTIGVRALSDVSAAGIEVDAVATIAEQG